VAGVVTGCSLRSTLVKRAGTPGVLVAFWRLTVAPVVLKLLLWRTGRRVTMRHGRLALVPGAFFGFLPTSFAGATHNRVANAALIGSLAPFLIVPVGAKLFREFNDLRALVFARVAFDGVGIVLLSAPPKGQASLDGNVFGFLAKLLLVA
jgi:drug/metabolite transporter (DMT)-like permease